MKLLSNRSIVFFIYLSASISNVYTQNQLIPFEKGNQWIYAVHTYSSGLTGSRDTSYFDTISVTGSLPFEKGVLWTLSNGHQYITRNDTVFAYYQNMMYVQYIPLNKIPATLANGVKFSFISDSIKTPYGSYSSGVQYQHPFSNDGTSGLHTEAIVPGIGVVIDTTTESDPEYFGITVKYLVSFQKKITGVSSGNPANGFALYQNYPNPFNPVTTIRYSVPQKGLVTISIFDRIGRAVAQILHTEQNEGRHTIEWNAPSLPSGIYFYRMQTEQFMETKKMLLLR
jgi:hypothetical protein